MLYNPSLRDHQSDTNYRTNLQILIQPFGDIHIPRVDVPNFDRSDTMVNVLDLMDWEHQTASNRRSLDIDPYDFLQCDIEYTILLHEFIFPS